MTPDDLMRMLIQAYELGLAAGNSQAIHEMARQEDWQKMKTKLLNDYNSLVTL